MQLLIVAATSFELLPFIRNNVAADFLITGVGSPACMFHLTKALQLKKYDFAIQAGIAGTFTPQLGLAETVLVKKDVFGDLGVQENNAFQTLFQVGLSDGDESPYQDGWLVNNNSLMNTAGLKIATSVTVNTIGDSPSAAVIYTEKFGAEIESMEGAAFHYCCLVENIRFLQLRAISNKVGVRDKRQWRMDEAITNLNDQLLLLIHKIQ